MARKEQDSVDEILKDLKNRKDDTTDEIRGIFDLPEVDESDEMTGFSAKNITYSGMSVFDEFEPESEQSGEISFSDEDSSDPTYNVSIDELIKIMEGYSSDVKKTDISENTDTEASDDTQDRKEKEEKEEKGETPEKQDTENEDVRAAEAQDTVVKETKPTEKKEKKEKKTDKKQSRNSQKKKEKEILPDIFEEDETAKKPRKNEKQKESAAETYVDATEEVASENTAEKAAEASSENELTENVTAEENTAGANDKTNEITDIFSKLIKMQTDEKKSLEEKADSIGKTKVFVTAKETEETSQELEIQDTSAQEPEVSESEKQLEAECNMNRREKIENFRIHADKIRESETYDYEEPEAPEKIGNVKSKIGEDIFSAIEKFVPKKENTKKQERKKVRESKVYEKIDVGRVRIRLNEALRKISISLVLSVISAVLCAVLEIIRLVYIKADPVSLSFLGENSVLFFGLTVVAGLPVTVGAVLTFISRLKNSEGFSLNNEVFLLLITVFDLIHGVFLMLSGRVLGENTISYGLVVSLLVITGILADKKEIKMILGNLDTLTKNERILGVFPIDKDTVKFASGISREGEPTVLRPGEVEIPDSFLDSSFIRDKQNSFFTFAVPLVIILSFLCGIVAALTYGGAIYFSTAFMSALLISSPAFVTLVLVSSISSVNRKLNSIGCEILGYEAVEYAEDIDAVSLDSADIFTGKISNFHLIKSETGFDTLRAFETACAVLLKSDGILSNDVRELIKEQNISIPQVDNIEYEDKLGLSCWMGDSRVLLGNFNMMKEHNVDIPGEYAQSHYENEGKRVFFLSVDGQAAAMFCAEYFIGRHTKLQLQKLCSTGAILMLTTGDPNVDEEFVSNTLDVSVDSVKIVFANAALKIRKSLTFEAKQQRTGLIFKDSISGLLKTINSAFRLYDIQSLTVLLQTVSMVFAFVLVCVLNVAATEYFASAGIIVIYHLLWGVLSHILSKKK